MDSKQLKTFGAIAIIIVLVGGGSYLFWRYRDKIAKPGQQSSQNQQVTGITVEDKKITDATKPFNIDVTYPFIKNSPGFNQKVNEVIQDEIAIFKKNASENDDAVKATDPKSYAQYPRTYDFIISYEKGQIDESIASVMISVSKFEGGAHGANYFIPVNYNIKDNTEITLADMFPGQKDYIKKISAYCSTDLAKQITEKMGSLEGSWISDGAGPKEENFTTFLINKNNLIFYFPQYQVAPYSAGDFQVVMPR